MDVYSAVQFGNAQPFQYGGFQNTSDDLIMNLVMGSMFLFCRRSGWELYLGPGCILE